MKFHMVPTLLLVAGVSLAAPFQTTTSTTEATITAPPPPPRLNAKEREALIAHLDNINQKQRLVIAQELEYQQLRLPAFSDSTLWQRLSREEQEEFNNTYVSLPLELQEFSKNQFTAFTNLPEDRQEHVFNMFITLHLETFTKVIEHELVRERQIAKKQRLAAEAGREERGGDTLTETKTSFP